MRADEDCQKQVQLVPLPRPDSHYPVDTPETIVDVVGVAYSGAKARR